MIHVPVTITARNEERAIGACIDSLISSKRFAERRLPVVLDFLVVLDDCTDRTEVIASDRGIACVESRGGKVEAQRRGMRPGPFRIFSDADILVAENTLHALCETMLSDDRVAVAFPPKTPLPPRRRTPLARALHVYNRRHGFSSQRTWFSGKLFAIRSWEIPNAEDLARRAATISPSRFYDYAAGMRVDDIYLSRKALLDGGPDALRETYEGLVLFRAPETWVGMYRYYRRMRMELERMDSLFPETREIHERHGVRGTDLLVTASRAERHAWHLFQAALFACRGAYVVERAYYERMSPTPCQPWPAIGETKAF
jgi:glycosyltransferase involved in cell wall biosynthesis